MNFRPSLSDVTGATLIRFERADGLTFNVDDEDARRTIGHGGIDFRAMPGTINGDMVVPYLYRVLRLDPHRFIFNLPKSMTSNGAVSAGSREGFVHLRELGTNSNPVGKVIFLTYDRKFTERDPGSRDDFERME